MIFNFNFRLLLVVATFFLLVATRLPFLSQPLLGEEGVFAVIVTGYGSEISTGDREDSKLSKKIKDNCYLVISHLSGVDTIIGPSRNIVPYCFLGLIVKPLVANIHSSLDEFDSKSLFIRVIFLFISSIGFISLCTLTLIVSKRLAGIRVLIPSVTLLFFATSKLALGSSIQPQIDGAFGFLLLSSSALFVYVGAIYSKNNFNRFLNNVIAGFLMALCKVEWPLVLFVAIGIGISLHIFIIAYKGKIDASIFNRESTLITLSICGGLLIGAVAGMYFCYLFSPLDYMSGISLMGNINGSKADSFYYSALKLISLNYEVIAPIFFLMIFGLVGVYKNKNNIFEGEIGLLILYLWSIGLLVGFLQSGWIGDGFPRYFLPSLLISGVFCITQIPYIFKSNTSMLISGFYLLLLFSVSVFSVEKELKKYNAGRSITVPGNYIERKKMILKAGSEYKRDPFVVAVISPTIRYYFPEANFISIDIGMNDVLNKKLPDSRYYLTVY